MSLTYKYMFLKYIDEKQKVCSVTLNPFHKTKKKPAFDQHDPLYH